MRTRCKFQLSERTEFAGAGIKLVFAPQYDDSIPEDQRFCRYTPSGRFEMSVSRDSAAAQLTVGKYYYLDCFEVPESAPTEAAATQASATA